MVLRKCGGRTKSLPLGEAGCAVPKAPQIGRWLGRWEAGGLGHWGGFFMGNLEAGTWSIPEHLPLVPSRLQGTAPLVLAAGLCSDNRMSPPLPHHPHRVTPPGAQVPKVLGATASPREAQEPAQGQGQPLVLQQGPGPQGPPRDPAR